MDLPREEILRRLRMIAAQGGSTSAALAGAEHDGYLTARESDSLAADLRNQP